MTNDTEDGRITPNDWTVSDTNNDILDAILYGQKRFTIRCGFVEPPREYQFDWTGERHIYGTKRGWVFGKTVGVEP